MFYTKLIMKENAWLFHNNKFKEVQNTLPNTDTSFQILVKSIQNDFNNFSLLFCYFPMKLVGHYPLGIFFFSLVNPFGACERSTTGLIYLSHSQFHIV